MFKFEIIESPSQVFENPLINLMKKKIKYFESAGDSLTVENKAIFIVAEEKEKGVFGGAFLLKKELNEIQEDVRELVTTLSLHGYVWECPIVYLEMPYGNLVAGAQQLDSFSRSFYRGLYGSFVEFGKRKGVGFVIMKLAPEVYDLTKKFGLWPYVVELRPKNSPDGLFHGILALKGSQYEAYQKTE